MILVTGGAGFIGSNIVASLAADGTPVVVCDHFGSGDKWRNVAKHDLADLVAPVDLAGWLAGNGDGVTAVVHMGAISSTTERDVDLIIASNFKLSVDLWRFCADRRIPLVYASSAATYGDGGRGFDDAMDADTLAGLRPLNPYGWSKHQFDRWVARQVSAQGAGGAAAPPAWAGLKFFNVYGPNEYHKGDMMSVVAKAHAAIARGEPVKLFKSHHPDYADGGQLRDFVAVDDCVAIVRWLLNTPGVHGLFNVGSGTARSFADLVTAVYAALGRDPEIEYIPMPEAIRGRYQYFTEAPMARLRQAGYNQPPTSLEDGVRAYVQDYLATDDPYR